MTWKLRYAIVSADLLWITAVFAVAYWLPSGLPVYRAEATRFFYTCALPIWTGLYFTKKLEGFRGGWYLPHICAQVTVGVFYLTGSLFALRTLTHSFSTPQIFL